MAEYIRIYHDKDERHRSTYAHYDNVAELVRGILTSEATVLIISDGSNEKRFVPEDSQNGNANPCVKCGERYLHLTSCDLWQKDKPERHASPVLDSERKQGCRGCGETEKHLQTCDLNGSGVDGERTEVLKSERV